MDLGLELGTANGVTVIAVRGDLDLASAPRLRDAMLRQLLEGEGPLVADLGDLEFVDSVGLGTLVAVLRRARSLGTDVVLVITRDRIRAPFELTRLTGAFAIHDSVDAAVAAITASRTGSS